MIFQASTPNLPEHLAEEQLFTIACGELKPAESAQAHLYSCQQCQEQLAAIELVLLELEVARLSEPSPHAVERYLALFREVDVNATGPLAAVVSHAAFFADAIKVAVMWNGRERLALQGVRTVGTASYRMLYSTEEAEIELMVEPVAGDFKIEGELLPVTAERQLFPLLLEIHDRSRHSGISIPVFTGESDDEGRFHVPPIPAGEFAIYLAPVDGQALVIESLELV
ncbi:MAG: hypothetical protein KDE31_25120 [Caldilineaceae bacterium]|nr:hypothetical protein [Caldilineaceae bacterium]